MVPPIKRLLDSKTASKNERLPKCQKCLEDGHWTYQCKGKQKFVSRVSRTKLLQKSLKKAKTATFSIDDKEVLTWKKMKTKGIKTASPRLGQITNRSTSNSSSSGSSSSDSSSSSSSDESVTSPSISSDTDSSSSTIHELASS